MKKSLRFCVLLALAAALLTVSAFADTGPKAQLKVLVKNAPEEPYYLDLLEKGDYQGHTYGSGDGDDTYSGLDWSYSEEEIAALDSELLDALRAKGIQCAVFSNKADPLCGKIIAHYFGTGRFAAVRGSRPGVPTKPDPAGLYALMDEIGADRSATLFVGDSDVDILTGHNAGLPAMGALWGFRGRAELTAAGADALAAVPEDIFTYIQKG